MVRGQAVLVDDGHYRGYSGVIEQVRISSQGYIVRMDCDKSLHFVHKDNLKPIGDSKVKEEFKKQSLHASQVIKEAKGLRAVSDDYEKGFHDAMWEAREIMQRVVDSYIKDQTETE